MAKTSLCSMAGGSCLSVVFRRTCATLTGTTCLLLVIVYVPLLFQSASDDLNSLVVQVLISIQVGNFQELCPPNVSPPPLISDMEAQLEALPAAHSLPYCWLPAAALGALVQLLAAVILKPTGKVKAALLHISRGTSHMSQHLLPLVAQHWSLHMVLEALLDNCTPSAHMPSVLK